MEWRVHLIPSDLWEAITGEHLSPANLCQLCDILIPDFDPKSPLALHYFNIARDRAGSRYLQQQLDECSPQERKLIFDSLVPHLFDLIFDPFSNYVVQKLCEHLTPEHQPAFLAFFLADMPLVIDHPNACRVLQKFIERTSQSDVDRIFLALRPDVLRLCRSPNGNHIVQRFIEILPGRASEIVAILQPKLASLVTDNCGCRVVQRMFEHCDIAQLRPFVEEVLACAADLATDQYGNYIVQNVLAAASDRDIAFVIDSLFGGYSAFSVHKFASNVIEQCIRRASPAQRHAIFTEIIGAPGNWEAETILKMARDQFGNFVMQRIIEFGSDQQRHAIFNVVLENYWDLVKRSYAKHVILKLENLGFDFGAR
jgi:hypothetical protein